MNVTMLSKRRLTALAAALALPIALTSCSDTPGQPVPQHPSSEQAPDNALDDLDPCEMLSKAEIDRFGAADGKPDSVGGARRCVWLVSGSGVFSIGLRNEQGLDDIVVGQGTIVDHRVGKHDGRKVEEGDGYPGACLISIGIAESTRVDVSSSARSDTAKACGYATEIAKLIEPKLPRGE